MGCQFPISLSVLQVLNCYRGNSNIKLKGKNLRQWAVVLAENWSKLDGF